VAGKLRWVLCKSNIVGLSKKIFIIYEKWVNLRVVRNVHGVTV
jgi:hypothetical protein